MVLPSLDEVQNAVSVAKSWLKNSEQFLASAFLVAPASCSLLRLESLKVIFMLIDSSFSCYLLHGVLKLGGAQSMTSRSKCFRT